MKENFSFFPTVKEIETELERGKYKERYNRTLFSTVAILTVTAAIVVLLSFLLFPIFRIYGNSMTPTVNEGEIVVSVKSTGFETGDVIVLSFNNKLLVKRIIAGPGQWVNIDSDGNVYVDGKLLHEPYIGEKALGNCNITLPYQVPEDSYFVMGDNRAVSIDSRTASVGCIPEEQLMGHVIMRIWPFSEFGAVIDD